LQVYMPEVTNWNRAIIDEFRANGGKVGGQFTGAPLLLVTTTGAKSGQSRTVPVLGIPTEGEVAIIASNFGQYRHPGWYHNLRANPDAEVVIDGNRRRVRADEAVGERRSEIWQEGLRVYPGFGEYERRASHRDISVFVLKPV